MNYKIVYSVRNNKYRLTTTSYIWIWNTLGGRNCNEEVLDKYVSEDIIKQVIADENEYDVSDLNTYNKEYKETMIKDFSDQVIEKDKLYYHKSSECSDDIL
jgi:hypothetical protein